MIKALYIIKIYFFKIKSNIIPISRLDVTTKISHIYLFFACRRTWKVFKKPYLYVESMLSYSYDYVHCPFNVTLVKSGNSIFRSESCWSFSSTSIVTSDCFSSETSGLSGLWTLVDFCIANPVNPYYNDHRPPNSSIELIPILQSSYPR